MPNVDMTDRIIVTGFTDPICTWCWGSEPIYRALETHFPDEIIFRYITGGLVKDITEFYDEKNSIGGKGAEIANEQIMRHWLEASDRHGMPVRSAGFHLFAGDRVSSYPQNIAYKAAQKLDASKADRYLRRIREATAAEAQLTNTSAVLINLAEDVGYPREEFEKMLQSPVPKAAFKGDLYINQTLGVTGYPTTEVKYNSEKQLLRGYHPFSHYVDVIQKLSQGTVNPVAPEVSWKALLHLMQTTPRLAPEEIRQAFDFNTREQTEDWADMFVEEGKLIKTQAGNGYFYTVNTST